MGTETKLSLLPALSDLIHSLPIKGEADLTEADQVAVWIIESALEGIFNVSAKVPGKFQSIEPEEYDQVLKKQGLRLGSKEAVPNKGDRALVSPVFSAYLKALFNYEALRQQGMNEVIFKLVEVVNVRGPIVDYADVSGSWKLTGLPVSVRKTFGVNKINDLFWAIKNDKLAIEPYVSDIHSEGKGNTAISNMIILG